MDEELMLKRMLLAIGDTRNKRIVELGCGEGFLTEHISAGNAYVCATEISPVALNQTKERVEKAGLKNYVDVAAMSSEYLAFQEGTFDVAVGMSVLHHLDLSKALPEIHRVRE